MNISIVTNSGRVQNIKAPEGLDDVTLNFYIDSVQKHIYDYYEFFNFAEGTRIFDIAYRNKLLNEKYRKMYKRLFIDKIIETDFVEEFAITFAQNIPFVTVKEITQLFMNEKVELFTEIANEKRVTAKVVSVFMDNFWHADPRKQKYWFSKMKEEETEKLMFSTKEFVDLWFKFRNEKINGVREITENISK